LRIISSFMIQRCRKSPRETLAATAIAILALRLRSLPSR
jgi:hypothetical protein